MTVSEKRKEQLKRASAKYDQKNTVQIHLKLNLITDAEVIDFLKNSGNVQGTIKMAVLQYIESQKQ